MDQIKIGAFIASCRKAQTLTQAEVAEALGITDRAVSKWENGRSMPDASLMLPLCALLNINANELLAGEKIPMDKYTEYAEKNLVALRKENESYARQLLRLEAVFGTTFCALFIAVAIGLSYAAQEGWISPVLTYVIVGILTVCILAFAFFLIKIEQRAGYYECAKCHHRYVPEYKTMLISMHMGRTRYMRCPECGQKSWQKKRLTSEKSGK